MRGRGPTPHWSARVRIARNGLHGSGMVCTPMATDADQRRPMVAGGEDASEGSDGDRRRHRRRGVTEGETPASHSPGVLDFASNPPGSDGLT